MERKKFLVCVDSDGCALDTMDAKHKQCFAPLMVEKWHMEAHRKEAEEIWNRFSLYSVDRGINRFKGLELALKECGKRGFLKEDLTDLSLWLSETDTFSNESLERQIGRTDSPLLKKVLDWSITSNQEISALPPSRPFAGVRETLEQMSRQADLAVVSSANRESVEAEWNRHGLIAFVKEVMAQDSGSKASCIARLMAEGYDRDCVLMLGDAPGDKRAAEKNGALFFPIVAGREEESWRRLSTEGLKRFFEGTYRGEYADGLLGEFLEALK
ncbi:MAG TPA: HAD hydrolase-like protein [Candidatus Lachnoclostridium stercorigallinarum]|uniref:HAD hydrolase-like protein n=1 Tax=Candidatus Lachnoclostridium stercorigallinarum TaxID=2838634 RepID=A0A9D2GHC1_9FIRM|nr:HAD hydrolase-like protein [Candidatus Lachnoclostridium stercorigallinarum]